MAECSVAVVLSAILVSSGFHFFITSQNNEKTLKCVSLPYLIFLTAIFVWVTANNIKLFPGELPMIIYFIYEALVSLFIYEMVMKLIWEPIEMFLTSTLPKYLKENVPQEFLSFLCSPEDPFIFKILVYVTAGSALWVMLYTHGVFTKCEPLQIPPQRDVDTNIDPPVRRRSARITNRRQQ